MTLAGRLQHLEQASEEHGRCPDCPAQVSVVCRDGCKDFAEPLPCETCGRAADVSIIRVVRDRNFYGNAHRLQKGEG